MKGVKVIVLLPKKQMGVEVSLKGGRVIGKEGVETDMIVTDDVQTKIHFLSRPGKTY